MTLEPVAPSLWRLPLESATLPPFDHTNSYLVASQGEAALVDAGAGDEAAVTAVREALEQVNARLTRILLTHAHGDHSAGAAAMQAAFGAPPVLLHPLEQDRVAGAVPLGEGSELAVGGVTVRALHTPGHSPGHLSFYLPDVQVALVGDVLAGAGTTFVGAPEGRMRDYLKTLKRLDALGLARIGPGHGPIIEAPQEKIAEVRAHRLAREAQILEALAAGAATLPELFEMVYPALPHEGLRLVAEKTLLAHLVKLVDDGRVAAQAGHFRLLGAA